MGFFADLAAAELAKSSRPTAAEETEIRAHLDRLCGPEHKDYPEALACALRDPGAALEAFRADGKPSARLIPEEQSREAYRAVVIWLDARRRAAA